MPAFIPSLSYLKESGHEVRGKPLVSPEVLLLEVRHDVGGLLPEVHHFLRRALAMLVPPSFCGDPNLVLGMRLE